MTPDALIADNPYGGMRASRPSDRRTRHHRTAGEWGRIVLGITGILAGSGGAGYYAGLAAIGERVRAVEVRQDEQYKALVSKIDSAFAATGQRIDDVKYDINGARAEILTILRAAQ